MKKIYVCDLAPSVPVELLCWVSNKRTSKNTIFLDVYDSTGNIQAVVNIDSCDGYEFAKKVPRESAVALYGFLDAHGDFFVTQCKVLASATTDISPSPNENGFDILNKRHERQVIEHPTFYIRNHKLKAIYYIKAVFKREIQNYFWSKNSLSLRHLR